MQSVYIRQKLRCKSRKSIGRLFSEMIVASETCKNLVRARLKLPGQSEADAPLGNIDLAQFSSPVVDVLKDRPVDTLKMREIKVACHRLAGQFGEPVRGKQTFRTL